MARQPAHNALDVYLNGKLVGQFRRERTGAVDFHYDQSWLDWENAIPVSLSLPLREDRYIGDPVIAVFDNLLPDNDAIRQSIAAKTGALGPRSRFVAARQTPSRPGSRIRRPRSPPSCGVPAPARAPRSGPGRRPGPKGGFRGPGTRRSPGSAAPPRRERGSRSGAAAAVTWVRPWVHAGRNRPRAR